MKVTYIYHSSFLVETENVTILFDYFKGNIPAIRQDIPLLVFASHKHQDHFSFDIFQFANHPAGVTYLLGKDIKLSDTYLQRHGVNPSVKEHIYRLLPHETQFFALNEGKVEASRENKISRKNKISQENKNSRENSMDEIRIDALRSTDCGDAFLITVDGERIYHAGDLNWWHWEEEGADKKQEELFNQNQERLYKEEITFLKSLLGENDKIDAAFVVLDPRLGKFYHFGMDVFLQEIPVNKVFPMHMWEDYEVIERYLLTENGSRFKKHIFFTNRT